MSRRAELLHVLGIEYPDSETATVESQSRNHDIYHADLGCLPTIALALILAQGIRERKKMKIVVGAGGLIVGPKLSKRPNPDW